MVFIVFFCCFNAQIFTINFVITEPPSVPDHTVAVNVSTNLEEGGVQAKESGHPLDNGEIPISEKDIVVEKEVVATQNDAHPVSEAVASSVQEDAPKKSYASVVSTFIYIFFTRIGMECY
jgi:hypothetical protein